MTFQNDLIQVICVKFIIEFIIERKQNMITVVITFVTLSKEHCATKRYEEIGGLGFSLKYS